MKARPGQWLRPATGARPDHPALIGAAARAPVVLLGETHDRADHHRWQLSVLAGLLAHRADLVVGFEMFPARVDPVLADWVAGRLTEAALLARTDWAAVWGFAAELYLPLFHFCRQHRLRMIGLNCARDLVRAVGAVGWEGVPDASREGITPAAPATEAYRRYLFAVTGGRRAGRAAQDAMDPAFDRFVRAQTTWDRAFACRIAATRRRGASGLKPDTDLDSCGPQATNVPAPPAGPIGTTDLDSSRVTPATTPPLVVGIIGRGHLELRGGTPHQLADLGLADAMVLLPVDAGDEVPKDLADAVFGLDPVVG